MLEEITPESCNSINFPGVLTTLKNAVNVPPLPEYWGAVEILIRPIHPFVVSELEVKEVLDQAAKEAKAHQHKRRYSKQISNSVAVLLR